MLKKWIRSLLSNPFDRMLKKCQKKSGESKHVLLAWNRGLGDIALGLYAMVQRIREIIPGASITFLVRKNLYEGFTLLRGVQILVAPSWVRGKPYDVRSALSELGIDPQTFDLIIDRPSPTDWVRWQLGTVMPKLLWKEEHDPLCKKFLLPEEFIYIGVQVAAETSYGLWRNWPEERWRELLELLPSSMKMILFGFGYTPGWDHPQVIDLRGKTSLFEMMSIIKNRCRYLIVPDSGILSMMYYLDCAFPLDVISLWADPHHGILKQNVRSPNPLLVHRPLIASNRNLSNISARQVYEYLAPLVKPFQPFKNVVRWDGTPLQQSQGKVGCIILAGGQGTRLGSSAPKGMFSILGKTLFERIVQKIPDQVPIAIMTSPSNHAETVRYFEEHGFFGRNISFFQQSTLPLLDADRLTCGIEGPDGNGSLYRSFVDAKLADRWAQLGISTVAIIPVDNALANPLDPALLRLQEQSGSEVAICCIEREAPSEAMGVLIEREGKLEVLEYCDISSKQMGEIEPDGKLAYLYAYTGLVSMQLSFIYKAASIDLPVHWVQKTVIHQGKSWSLWKGEKFLFDAFPFAKSTVVLCRPREACYAPLKTREGPHGIDAVEKALCQ